MSKTETTATPETNTAPGRRKLRAAGRKKRAAKLADPEAAKKYFEAKSKRATDKKAAFRKKKTRKK